VGKGDRDELQLPEQEAEVRDDDGRSECRKRNPVGITDEEDGEEDDEELVAFGEALKADLAALPEVLVRHGDRVPDSVMHSAALALWPAEAPPHAPLGLGTFEALERLASQAKIVWGEGMVKKPWWRFW
jgi:hypothetical protein